MKHIVYSDGENQRWWNGLGKTGQAEILDRIIDNADGDFGTSLKTQWLKNQVAFSTKQLTAIRKWDR